MNKHSVKIVDRRNTGDFQRDAEKLLDLGYEMKDFQYYETDTDVTYVAVFIKEGDRSEQ